MIPVSRPKIPLLLATVCVLVAVCVAVSACGGSTTTTLTSMASSSTSTASASVSRPGISPGISTTGTTKALPLPQLISPQSVKRKYTNLRYTGRSLAQRLDIYLPDSGRGPFPVIVQIHGGAFSVGDKADTQLDPVLSALSRGYAVVAINYRLSWEAKFPAAVNDAKAAVRYIRANARTYDLDPTRIAAWGDSAGGYLAAMLGTSRGISLVRTRGAIHASQWSMVQAVVDWYGPMDFGSVEAQWQADAVHTVTTDNAANSWESRFLGGAVSQSPGLVKKADPLTYAAASDPPFLVEHGTADKIVPVQQSENFAAALTKILGANKVKLVLLPGASHGYGQFDSTENLDLVLNWLDAHLK